MTQRRFEIFIAVILTIISYLGSYYLKEPLIPGVEKHSFAWHVLNILWLLSMVIIGYWGLKDHEFKWLKAVWIIVNSVLLVLLLGNKLTQHFWQHAFLPDGTSSIIRTPFFFLMTAFLPRWFMRYKTS